MSVAGIDVGDAASCIALARKGGKKLNIHLIHHLWIPIQSVSLYLFLLILPGVDVLLNKESNRETPSVVAFSAKQRMMGTSAGELAIDLYQKYASVFYFAPSCNLPPSC